MALITSQIEKGFPSTLVDGIVYRLQDVTYRFGLVQQEFVREIKFAYPKQTSTRNKIMTDSS
jgi:hypothetical protein